MSSTDTAHDPHQEPLANWLHAIRQQDDASQAALRSLYHATSPKLFGFVLRLLKKRELAEEVLQ